MRVIDAFDTPVRTATVSPDGRFLAATAGESVSVWDWLGGGKVTGFHFQDSISQLAFTADGNWVVVAHRSGLYWLSTDRASSLQLSGAAFSGGVAVSPTGKTLAATRAGHRQDVKLELWELPSRRSATGFDFWSPFDRLAFSPNGEFLAGINRETFELRIAVTGGLNGRHRLRHPTGRGFLTFAWDSQTVLFGWDAEFHIMETRNGNVLRRVPSPDTLMFLGAAFTGSGRQLATVNGTPIMRVWSADSWQITRGYDWGAGGLTTVTIAPDGLAGVCGTDTGKLVVFDVDD